MRPPRRALLSGVLLVGLLGGILALPATTRQGFNSHVSERHVPLGIKTLEFFLRDDQYRRSAAEITRGLATEEARAHALFNWTQQHIHPTPQGWPIIDDHIAHILIRGYGEEDQMADVFTTLATYAGLPSFWRVIRVGNTGALVLSFVKINGTWTVWDVARGVAFKNEEGRLVAVAELIQNPERVKLSVGPASTLRQRYQQAFEDGLTPFSVPTTLRAEEQMPSKRILIEVQGGWRNFLAFLREKLRATSP